MAIDIEDRTLAHLKVVITTKLRRGESFTLSWKHTGNDVPGRSTIWLHPSIPLHFVFREANAPDLDKEWLEELAQSASSTGGVTVGTEQGGTPRGVRDADAV